MTINKVLLIHKIFILMLASVMALGLSADSVVTAEVFAVSESNFRGLSEAPDKPAIGLNLELSNSDWNNVYIGTSLQKSRSLPVQQREQSIVVYAGWQKELSDTLALGLALSHREFPGSTKEWDYSEFNVALGWAELIDLELSFSPDYYEHGASALIFSARGLRSLSRDFYASFEAGTLSFSNNNFIEDYQYAELGVGYRKRRFISELSYSEVSIEGDSVFGAVARSPGVKLRLSYLLK